MLSEEGQLYTVPENWIWTNLGSCLENIQYGYTETASSEEIGPKFLRITDIQNDKVDWNSVPYCKINEKDLEKYLLKDDDIVVARTGATTGKSYLINEPVIAVFASYLIRLRKSKAIYPKYLWNYMKSPMYWKQIMVVKKGSAQPGANAQILGNLSLPLPPLNEQKRIAEKIECLLEKIEEAKALIEEAKETFENRRVAILDKAFRGELSQKWRRKNDNTHSVWDYVLNKHNERIELYKKNKNINKKIKKPDYLIYDIEKVIQIKPDLPNNWIQAPAGFLCDTIVPGRDKPKSFTGSIPWVTIPDLSGNYVYESREGIGLSLEEIEEVKAKKIPVDSVIMSCVGRFGVSAIVGNEMVINQQLHAFLPSEMVLPEYLMYHIRFLTNHMKSIATSTTVAYLNKQNANSIPINLPPIEEQHVIVKILNTLLGNMNEVQENLKSIDMEIGILKQSVLSKALRGELGTNDPTEESAIELLKEVLQENIK
nr:restriction endonuclease subunit S [Bacillus sp. PLB03]